MSLLASDTINKIINGNFNIWQRGTTFTSVPTSWGSYTADRWSMNQYSTAVIVYSRDTDVPSRVGVYYSLKANVTTAQAYLGTGYGAYILQNIEGYIIKPLVGKVCTLSFWIKSDTTGIMSIVFWSGSGGSSYVSEVTINAVSTWEYKTITFLLDTTLGTWGTFTNATGMTVLFQLGIGTDWQTSTLNTWTTEATTMASTNQTNFIAATSKAVWVTAVQLNLGSKALPFTSRLMGQEIRHCMRYYYKADPHAIGVVDTVGSDDGKGGIVPGTHNDVGWKHPVPMRVAPVLTIDNGYYIHNGVDNDLGTAIVSSSTTTEYARFNGSQTALAMGAAPSPGIRMVGYAPLVYCDSEL